MDGLVAAGTGELSYGRLAGCPQGFGPAEALAEQTRQRMATGFRAHKPRVREFVEADSMPPSPPSSSRSKRCSHVPVPLHAVLLAAATLLSLECWIGISVTPDAVDAVRDAIAPVVRRFVRTRWELEACLEPRSTASPPQRRHSET